MISLKNRLPPRQDLLLVFSGCAFLIHVWAIINMFYIVPAWVLRMNLAQLSGSMAYMLVFALVESLLVWGLLALLAVLLPKAWLRRNFLAQGMSLALVTAIFSMVVHFNYEFLVTNRGYLLALASRLPALRRAQPFHGRAIPLNRGCSTHHFRSSDRAHRVVYLLRPREPGCYYDKKHYRLKMNQRNVYLRAKLSRRDFLKLSLSLGMYAAGLVGLSNTRPLARLNLPAGAFAPGERRFSLPPNILIIVFDALSGRHLPFYGYPRQTTPNLARLAARANVYHAHQSAGNFTTPGTTSILTGVYPWKHRALHLHGPMLEEYARRTIFNLAAPDYFSSGYSHNLLVTSLLYQAKADLDAFNFPAPWLMLTWNTPTWSSPTTTTPRSGAKP